MGIDQIIERAGSAVEVRHVFGEPYERDGVTIIPAAVVAGGGGGGGNPAGTESNEAGAGFGMRARPAGAYVIQNGKARWRPAIDVNRIVLGAQIVAALGLLTLRALLLASARRPVGRRLLLRRLLRS